MASSITLFLFALALALGLSLRVADSSVKYNSDTLAKSREADSSDCPCIGFDKCPPFPQPYNGTYPTTYDYSGTFPEGFVWGLGTASYQVEGAYNEDGRGCSIWDTFNGVNSVNMVGSLCDKTPCPINDGMFDAGATGAVADNQYHTIQTTAEMMKKMGLPYYRFSIAWPRIVPSGRVADGINQKGIDYYNKLIDELIKNGVQPAITLYHWDLPQGLLDSSKKMFGWYSVDKSGKPSYQIVQNFLDYAAICFKNFGDRVKFWITFNEAWTFTYLASGNGKAPGIPEYNNITKWPYIAGHNVLMAHIKTVELYRTKFASQAGKIGMTNNVDWREPRTHAPEDCGASERQMLFWLGWFCDPLYFGDYPDPMKRLVGDNLPTFNASEKALFLKYKPDFFGLNHYGSAWVSNSEDAGFMMAYGETSEDGFPKAQSDWLYGSGWGFRKLLNWVHNRYHPKGGIIVTENGWSLKADNVTEGTVDPGRMYFYANYTSEMLKAIKEDGVDVRGYFAWSLMDNYEWERGYTERFGLIYNDYGFGFDPNSPSHQDHQPTTTQKRYLKDSACWFMDVWATNKLSDPADFSGCPWREI